MELGVVGTVHDALGVQVAQTVGDDTQVVVAQSWDSVVVVLEELSYLIARHLLVVDAL